METILDFTSVEDRWSQLLTEEAERERKATQVADPAVDYAAEDILETAFSFMHSSELENIVRRDYAELQRVKSAGGIKSQYMLCGGLIEALLLDALQDREPDFEQCRKAPKSKGGVRPLAEWGLGELIDVARELNVIDTDAEQFSHGVRNYRNLIHPSKELRSGQKVAEEEAHIAEKVLHIVIRELAQKSTLPPPL